MLKSCGLFVFGGSQSIAHMQIGWNINNILEMTEDMPENNSYHFIQNYPNTKVLKPSEWNIDSFLNNLKNEHIDLLFTNNPCSGLSYINRNSSINQPANKRFYEVFNVIDRIEPKCFLMENAPALVSTGTPILQDMINKLGNRYNFTIIRDMAGNHNVCMKRLRTLVIGWNQNYFIGTPVINSNIKKEFYIKDAFEGLNDSIYNMEEVIDPNWDNLKKYYYLVKPNSSILRACCENYNIVKNDLTKTQNNQVLKAKNKLQNGGNIWDKSPWRLDYNSTCSSLTSVTRFIHPIENRNLYVREYARIMGYPDYFKFYPNECKCNVIQCIAQGVPVNFIKYISKEIKRCFEQYYMQNNNKICFQINNIDKRYYYNIEEFNNLENLLHNK